MTDLHWSDRRALEKLSQQYSDRDIDAARDALARATSADDMLAAAIALLEYAAGAFAEQALMDNSKYPQRLQGCAIGVNSVLKHDFYVARNARAKK